MEECLICIINEKARKEFMDFLNWLSKQPYYESIQAEYLEQLKRER